MDVVKYWNSLTNRQKRAFGDRFIINNSNLNTWCKEFKDLSSFKKKQIESFLPKTELYSLNYII